MEKMVQVKFFKSSSSWYRNNSGGAIRSVCEVLGIQDVVASPGSANPHNVLKACVNGLKSQNSPKILSAIRGKNIRYCFKTRDKIMELNSLIKVNKKKLEG